MWCEARLALKGVALKANYGARVKAVARDLTRPVGRHQTRYLRELRMEKPVLVTITVTIIRAVTVAVAIAIIRVGLVVAIPIIRVAIAVIRVAIAVIAMAIESSPIANLFNGCIAFC
jgi:acyl-CoA thioesterase FadM